MDEMNEEYQEDIELVDIAWDEAKEPQLIPTNTEVMVKVIDAPWGESQNGAYIRLVLKAQGLEYEAPAFSEFLNIPDRELNPDYFQGNLNRLAYAAKCFDVSVESGLRLHQEPGDPPVDDDGNKVMKKVAIDFVGKEGSIIVGQKKRKKADSNGNFPVDNTVAKFLKPVEAVESDIDL